MSEPGNRRMSDYLWAVCLALAALFLLTAAFRFPSW
jgi:hypothetical protein